MKISREQLDFIKYFQTFSCTDTKISDKVIIKVKKNSSIFSLITPRAVLVKKIEIESEEEFLGAFPIKNLYSLIKTLKDKVEIEFIKDTIRFKNAEYSFETSDISSVEDCELILSRLSTTDGVEISLKNIRRMGVVLPYIGDARFTDVAFYKNAYIATDGNYVISTICVDDSASAKNEPVLKYYFSREIIKTLSEAETNEEPIQVRQNADGIMSLNLADTIIIVQKEKKFVPDIFSDDFKSQNDHKYNVEIDREEFVSTLQRIKSIAQDNPESRIYITFAKDAIVIESKDYNKSREEISAVVDSELISNQIIVSSKNLEKICMSLTGEKLKFGVPLDKEAALMRITDSIAVINFYNILFEDKKK